MGVSLMPYTTITIYSDLSFVLGKAKNPLFLITMTTPVAMDDLVLGEKPYVEPLVLYKLVRRSRVQNCIDGNSLPKEHWEWHIALREQLEEAVQREIRYAGHVGKDSHVVLRVTFHPLGIAFFTTSCGDEAYQFKPVLHKVAFGGSTDWGAWRFIRDLPLSMKSCLGEPMVSSEWLEIW